MIYSNFCLGEHFPTYRFYFWANEAFDYVQVDLHANDYII